MKHLAFFVLILLLGSGCTPNVSSMVFTIANAAGAETHAGDPLRGEDIFRHGSNGAPACISCHALEPGAFALAPDLHGVSARAGERITGLAAHDYIQQSIVDPHAFVVPGFRDLMYPAYADSLGEQDIQDLIAFLQTL